MEPSAEQKPQGKPRTAREWVKWAWNSWATRSLAVGGVATVVDVCVLLVCKHFLHLMTPVCAAIGVLVGSTLTFFLNRHFAFRDHKEPAAPQAVKFALATGVCMLIHAGLVGFLTDRLGVPVVVSKLIADICVFSVGQLLVLRYLVFPKKKHGAESAGEHDHHPHDVHAPRPV